VTFLGGEIRKGISIIIEVCITSLNPHSAHIQSGTVYSCLSTSPAGQRSERNFALVRGTYAIPTLEKDFEDNIS